MISLLGKSARLFPILALVLLWACHVSDSGEDQYLTWSLSEAYKDYDRVVIDLVKTGDTTLVYEHVWNAKLPDPTHFPKYRLTVAKGKDFTIQIRGYNAANELLLAKDLDVVASTPQTSMVLRSDVRLFNLSVSPGSVTPAFVPGTFSYMAVVPDSVSSLALTAVPIDPGNSLTLNQKAEAWDHAISQDLQPGANVLELTVTSKDGSNKQTYHLVVSRGKAILPEEVLSVTLKDKSLVLYTGDPAASESATVVPAGALMQWKSLNAAVASVDANGKVTAVGPGRTKIIVTAGNFADTADVTVNVTLDTVPPAPPKVTGTSPTNVAPKWYWSTGGGGGSGDFRYKLNDSLLTTGATDTRDTSYALAAAPAAGAVNTLYVAERDSAGNWSKASGRAILFDASKPLVAIVTPQPSDTFITANATVAFAGTASGPNPIVKVAYDINNVAAADAVFDKGSWSIAAVPASEGSITIVTIIATDNIGNKGQATLYVLRDSTPPKAPIFTSSPATPTTAAKGSWAWGPGSDAAPGSGLNGKYRYSLDGGTTWTVTVANLVNDLALVEGSNVFSLEEQDMAGNWSTPPVTSLVKTDFTAPKIPVTSPATGATLTSIHLTLTGTVSDAGPVVQGTGVQSILVSGQASGSGVAVITGTNWTTGDLILKSGLDTLIVTATDLVGNASITTVKLNVNAAVPTVTILYPADSMLTNKDTLTVHYKVDAGAETTKLFNLTKEGPNSLTITSPANEAGISGIKTVTVIRDEGAPNAPTLKTAAALTNTNPVWTWTLNGDNAFGAGLATTDAIRYQLNGAGAYTVLTGTAASFTLTGAGEGTYSLIVQQLDRAGNWSANSNAVSITVDKTGPVVAVKSPVDGLVTSSPSVSLVCKVDNVDQTAIPKTLIPGADTLTCTGKDAAQNTSSKSIVVWYVPNVLFVNKASSGTGTGWTDALGTIQEALAKANSGSQIWVTGGSYTSTADDSGYKLPSGVSLYGSFSPTVTTMKSISDRTFGSADTTYLLNLNSSGNIISVAGTSTTLSQNVTVDGVQLVLNGDQSGVGLSYADKVLIKKTRFYADVDPSSSGLNVYNSNFIVDSCRFNSFSMEGYVISASGAQANSMSILNSVFSGNIMASPGGGAIVFASGYGKATVLNTQFLDVYPAKFSNYFHIQYSNTNGFLDVEKCTFQSTTTDGEAMSWGSANRTFVSNSHNATP